MAVPRLRLSTNSSNRSGRDRQGSPSLLYHQDSNASHHNVTDETDVDFKQKTMYCFGDSLNELQIYLFFLELHAQLKQIPESADWLEDPYDLNYEPNNEYKNKDLDSDIHSLRKHLKSMDLFRVTLRARTLQLLSDMITLCDKTLQFIEFELHLRESNLVPCAESTSFENASKITVQMSAIFKQKSEQIFKEEEIEKLDAFQNGLLQNGLQKQYSITMDSKFSMIFFIIMDKLSKLPKLKSFSIDIVNFPLECYDYFTYFDYKKNAFSALESISLNLGNKEILNSRKTVRTKLHEWILNHKCIKKIVIKLTDYEDWAFLDENARIIDCDNIDYKKRFSLTFLDRHYIDEIVESFIDGCILNDGLCLRLETFYFHSEISGIYDYHRILIKLFNKISCCNTNGTNNMDSIHLSFNDMRDIYLNRVVKSLPFECVSDVTLQWSNSCDRNWNNPIWSEKPVEVNDLDNKQSDNDDNVDTFISSLTWNSYLEQHRADFLCGVLYNDDNDGNVYNPSSDFKEKYYAETITDNANNNENSVKSQNLMSQMERAQIKQEWKRLHFGSLTIESLSAKMKTAKNLSSLVLTCFYGVQIHEFKNLLLEMSKVQTLDEIVIYSVQSRTNIIDGLKYFFTNGSSFIQNVTLLFIKNMNPIMPIKTSSAKMRRQSDFSAFNNLEEKSLFELIDVAITNENLFQECKHAYMKTLLGLGYSKDVSKIIIQFIFTIEAVSIDLFGLFHKIKRLAIKHFVNKTKQQHSIKNGKNMQNGKNKKPQIDEFGMEIQKRELRFNQF